MIQKTQNYYLNILIIHLKTKIISKIKNSDESETSNNNEIAEIFNNYFIKVFNNSNNKPNILNGNANTSYTIITQSMVLETINSMGLNSAHGPDKIPMKFWKNIKYSVAKPLAYMFTLFLNQNYIPTNWKNATIVPIFKGKGSKYEPENYRPISLTCAIARIFRKRSM